MSFSENLKARRKGLGLTTTQCAAAMKVSQPAWNQWELGLREPKFEKLREICELLDVSADWLLGLPGSRGGGGTATAHGAGAIAAAGNATVTVGPSARTESPGCAKCPYKKKVKALEKIFSTP